MTRLPYPLAVLSFFWSVPIFAQTVAPSTQASPPPGLKPPLHHWKFDVISPDQTSPDTGTAVVNIPASLTQLTLVPGKFGQALDFPSTGTATVNNGDQTAKITTNVSAFASIPLNLSMLQVSGFTISFWMKGVAPKAGYETFFDAGRKDGLEIRMNPFGQILVSVGQAWNWLKTPVHVTNLNSNWMQIIVTYTEGQSTLYVNGTLIDSKPIGSSTFQDHITLGGYFEKTKDLGTSPTLSTGFVGDLDDLQIFDYVLSQDQITALYKAVPPG